MSEKRCEIPCKFKCLFSPVMVGIALLFGILGMMNIESDTLLAFLSGVMHFFEVVIPILLGSALFKYLLWGGKCVCGKCGDKHCGK